MVINKLKLEEKKLSNSIATEIDTPQSQPDLPTVQGKNILEPARSPLREKEYLNINELHEYTGIKKSTIYKMTSTEEIPFMKPKGRLIFKRREIDKWMERK
ncbi:MAG: helix-turn-helix domain-containing protein [Candidatus Lokiarchaeota archaeon]|nr:helix-turn-helix domain-containing protein [Candidatus Lokiarchaeota archaeon]